MGGGFRAANGTFEQLLQSGNWWTATLETMFGDARAITLNYNNGNIGKLEGDKKIGLSVRLVRD